MRLTSSAFENASPIPAKHTCDGDQLLSPELLISDTPEGIRSLVLIIDDPDIPKILHSTEPFVHWVLFNISPDIRAIPEGEAPGTQGVNTAGTIGYTGPCPPPQYEPKTHRYFFTLYALDTMLDLPEGATKEDVGHAMEGRVLDTATLIGTYSRA